MTGPAPDTGKEPLWFERRVGLRWNDADELGHVNHTLYLAYMAESRYRLGGDALGHAGMKEFVTVRIEVDYLAELYVADEWVTARSRLLHVGTSSIRTLDEIVRPDGVVAARAAAVSVMTDRTTARSRPLTAHERSILESLL